MNITYRDLIDQTYYFPTEEFDLEGDRLRFHGVSLTDLIERYGSPLKFTYLPKISQNINRAKDWFAEAMEKHDYPGKYYYCYCTKSSHFRYVLHEALKNDIHIETSSAFDIDIVENLKAQGLISDRTYVICNGFKREAYVDNIGRLINEGHRNCIPIIDNYEELSLLDEVIDQPFKVGIRIASEEEPKFEFYTSRLGIGYKDIVPFYENQIRDNDKVELRMLHFFINTGIRDNAYYWNELNKCLKVYVRLKKLCPSLDSLNIGGGFPTKNSLSFQYDYAYMVDEIVNQIKLTCEEGDVPPPNIFTEFGSFTVGESGGAVYKVLYQKQQNDREKWNMIDSSFITTLPDSWAINKRFIMLSVNRWDDPYERVLLGGLTCDSDDYYNSQQDMNAIYLPKFHSGKPLYIGFFNTGAYQETIGGFGGLHHCLIPQPKHLLIDREENGEVFISVFSEQQTARDHMQILGYGPGPDGEPEAQTSLRTGKKRETAS
ncbi:arginine decarboxylase [Robiginitalea biformata]|uniref:Arginine decarboxylase n=1 Tax=Robiginitalea biformata (strain ATCC BAA-864 / DSM 15991 / KCTC 12146 / HTCC2501) TaxID=313596 RepID=A4CH73_ROBBH|nr:arginine decarboxylase [Robiginitalea biformata]EAR16281.1 arginine decarboxylase [Robiginitalea biformata HTCC2501]